MGQPLRITFKGKDYNFQILNSEPISKSDHEIQILLNDVTITLIKDVNGFRPKEDNDPEKVELFMAIGKVIALRYRI